MLFMNNHFIELIHLCPNGGISRLVVNAYDYPYRFYQYPEPYFFLYSGILVFLNQENEFIIYDLLKNSVVRKLQSNLHKNPLGIIDAGRFKCVTFESEKAREVVVFDEC